MPETQSAHSTLIVRIPDGDNARPATNARAASALRRAGIACEVSRDFSALVGSPCFAIAVPSETAAIAVHALTESGLNVVPGDQPLVSLANPQEKPS